MNAATTEKEERWPTNNADPQMTNSGTEMGSSTPTVWRVCQETDGVTRALQRKLRDNSIKPLTKAFPIPTNMALCLSQYKLRMVSMSDLGDLL